MPILVESEKNKREAAELWIDALRKDLGVILRLSTTEDPRWLRLEGDSEAINRAFALRKASRPGGGLDCKLAEWPPHFWELECSYAFALPELEVLYDILSKVPGIERILTMSQTTPGIAIQVYTGNHCDFDRLRPDVEKVLRTFDATLKTVVFKTKDRVDGARSDKPDASKGRKRQLSAEAMLASAGAMMTGAKQTVRSILKKPKITATARRARFSDEVEHFPGPDDITAVTEVPEPFESNEGDRTTALIVQHHLKAMGEIIAQTQNVVLEEQKVILGEQEKTRKVILESQKTIEQAYRKQADMISIHQAAIDRFIGQDGP